MHGQTVLLISFFLFSGCANSATIDINNQYAFTDENVIITCSLRISQSYQMLRLIQGETNVFSIMNLQSLCPTAQTQPPAMGVSFGGGFIRHSITNHSVEIHLMAKEAHNGHYKCAFMDGIKDYVSVAKRLVVGKLAYVKSLSVTPKAVMQGTMFNVSCIGSKGFPEGMMKIYSKNHIVGAVENQVKASDGTLLTGLNAQLEATRGSTEETFTCKSTNILNENRQNHGQSEMKVTVSFYDPPNTIEILPNKRHFNQGDFLTCNSRGHPAVTFNWLVSHRNASQVTNERFSGKKFELRDIGADEINVTCIAENTIGNKKYTDEKMITLTRRNNHFVNVHLHQNAPAATAKKVSSQASSVKSARSSVTHRKITTTSNKLISTPSLESQTTQLGFMPMTSSKSKTTITDNVTEVIKPKRKLTKTDRRYENVILYLKLSISFNLVFGVATLFTLIGLCLRVSNFMK